MDFPSEEHGMTERALRGHVRFVPSVARAGEAREHGCERPCPPQNSGALSCTFSHGLRGQFHRAVCLKHRT